MYCYSSRFVFFLSLLISTPLLANTKEPEWEKIREKNGIRIFKKHLPGNPLVIIKGEGVVDASMERVATVLLDIPKTAEWVKYLMEAKILKRVSENEFFGYARFKSPFFLIQDRDFVTRNSIRRFPATKTMVISAESTEDFPYEKTKAVRAYITHSTMTLRYLEENKTHISSILQSDPKGSIPKWIVNKFVETIPQTTFEALRERVKTKP